MVRFTVFVSPRKTTATPIRVSLSLSLWGAEVSLSSNLGSRGRLTIFRGGVSGEFQSAEGQEAREVGYHWPTLDLFCQEAASILGDPIENPARRLIFCREVETQLRDTLLLFKNNNSSMTKRGIARQFSRRLNRALQDL